MVGPYKVITLCGSTRFKDAFMDVQKTPNAGGAHRHLRGSVRPQRGQRSHGRGDKGHAG